MPASLNSQLRNSISINKKKHKLYLFSRQMVAGEDNYVKNDQLVRCRPTEETRV